MKRFYHVFLFIGLFLSTGIGSAFAQDVSFEASETCDQGAFENCALGMKDFYAADLLWSANGATGIVEVAECTDGIWCYDVGSGLAASLFYNDLADLMAFDFIGGAGAHTVRALNIDGEVICQDVSGKAPNMVTFDPGTSGNCSVDEPIAGLTFSGGYVDNVSYTLLTLPVELASLSAITDEQNISLRWETLSEENSAGFEVQQRINGIYQAIAFVDGAGTVNTPRSYSYQAENLAAGRHEFRLRMVDFDGTFTYSARVEADVTLPGSHQLSAAYPNPFNPTTQFTMTVTQEQQVTIELFTLLGRQVQTIHDGVLSAQTAHTFRLDASGLPSGMYLIRAIGADFTSTRQITLLK